MKAHPGTEFRAGKSGDITDPDLPMDKYSGRISYDGENAGGGSALFLRSVKRGQRMGGDLF